MSESTIVKPFFVTNNSEQDDDTNHKHNKDKDKEKAKKRLKRHHSESDNNSNTNSNSTKEKINESELDVEMDKEKEKDKTNKSTKNKLKQTTATTSTSASGAEAKVAPLPRPTVASLTTTVSSLKIDLAIAQTQLKESHYRESDLRQRLEQTQKELMDERDKFHKYCESVDVRSGGILQGVTNEIARSNNGLIRTVQNSQQLQLVTTVGAVFGNSLNRLKKSEKRMLELLPPSIVEQTTNLMMNSNSSNCITKNDGIKNSKNSIDIKEFIGKDSTVDGKKLKDQVAEFLTKEVTNLEKGNDFLQKLNDAIIESENLLKTERNEYLPPKEIPPEIKQSFEAQENALALLSYQKKMLVEGLDRKRQREEKEKEKITSATNINNNNNITKNNIPTPTMTPTPLPSASVATTTTTAPVTVKK
jgi:hypothetical protein